MQSHRNRRKKERRGREEERLELTWVAHQNKQHSCCSLFTKTGLVKDRQRAYCRPGSVAASHTHINTKDLLRVCQTPANKPKRWSKHTTMYSMTNAQKVHACTHIQTHLFTSLEGSWGCNEVSCQPLPNRRDETTVSLRPLNKHLYHRAGDRSCCSPLMCELGFKTRLLTC